MINLIINSALIIFGYAAVWFFISIVKKRNDLADIAWGLGYILLCAFYLVTGEVSSRALLLYFLVLIWGLRLSIHIYFRNRGKQEDFRYAKWRQEWGRSFYLRSFFQVYLLQGLLLLIVISPITLVASNQQPVTGYLDYLGLIVWVIGFFFETVGDYQLSKFVKNPENRGKLMTVGLWKYTRHPNYFGEVTMWWGIFLIAVSSPNGIFALAGPLTLTLLILFISGIPMLEKKYEHRPDFEEYKKQTSSFFPLPPKSSPNQER